ncbi:PAS domain S-box protein [Anaeroselena agilis]|uniref:histidine kinase n=1 Tax=Anaeroselena agilis TaxID=3063788 RepID=A0ABU3NTN7_9FIRM|nr:PAS domain S-box protein [Selenomonadales bacterium 4137-cl]
MRDECDSDALAREVLKLRQELANANNIIDAIRNGEVDALLMSGRDGEDGVYVLKGADRLYRVIVEEMQEGCLTLAPDGTVLFCNRRFAAMLGKPREEITGTSVYTLLESEDGELLKWISGVSRGGIKAEMKVRTGDGFSLPVLVTASEVKVDGEAFSCLIVTDLSEQKRRERMTKLIFDQSGEAIIVCDSQGKIARVNAAAAAMFGDGLLGADFNRRLFLTEERTGAVFHLQSAVAQGPVKGSEVCCAGPDGAAAVLLLSAGRLTAGDDARFMGYLVTMTNITEIKNYAREIGRLDRLNLIGQMAAGIGHGVRNPLTTVRGYLQFFLEKAGLAGHRESFRLMIDELDRANTIISDFLSLAKNKTIELQPTDLNKVIESVFPLLQADAFRRGCRLTLELAEIPQVTADEKEIRQCLLNLVQNGLDAVPEGGLVTVSTRWTGGEVIMAVHNDGPEIPPHVKEKLGTPFFTTKDKGTGLGLPVCFSIADRHNARLDVASRPSGTTFSLVFAEALRSAG